MIHTTTMSATREALSRTLLLLRDHLKTDVDDERLVEALTETRVAVVADPENLGYESAQQAITTVAVLCARWGARVHVVAPDTPLIGSHAPLRSGTLRSSLLDTLSDLIPGAEGVEGPSSSPVDVAVLIGDSRWSGTAKRVIYLNADAWAGGIAAGPGARWKGYGSPFGPLAAAGLAAGEAYKAAVMRLRALASHPGVFEAFFAPTAEATVRLAPAGTRIPTADLGPFDCISGGAIVQAAIYALARIPSVTGTARVIEPEESDLSNLNRYALLRRSHLGIAKALDLGDIGLGDLHIKPVVARYDASFRQRLGTHSPLVIVGVDDIPSRWEVQAGWPTWLGVGASTHYSAMVSYHVRGLGCAGCLHPRDEPGAGPLPTVSFVSHFAGLLLASLLVREKLGARPPVQDQSLFFTSLRAESAAASWMGPVPRSVDCPLACNF